MRGSRYQRKIGFPSEAVTLEQFATDLKTEKLSKILEGHTAKLQTKLIYDADKNPHLAMFDLSLIQKLGRIKISILDAFFKVCPEFLDDEGVKRYTQLLNVMSKITDNVRINKKLIILFFVIYSSTIKKISFSVFIIFQRSNDKQI